MKVIVRRNWADASNAWIDVQTYTGLKLPPPEIQYRLSFMDKDSIPAQMIVTSDGASWVDGLGGGYKGKTVLNMTIEEPQRGAGNEDADGLTTVTAADIESFIEYPDIIVSGAGTTDANGTYAYGGMFQDKPYYLYSDYLIFRVTYEEDELCEWIIAHGDFGSPLYSSGAVSYIGVDTPDLVTTWQKMGAGSLPVPTVTASAVTHSLPVSAGMVLSSDGDGHAQWATNNASVFDGANMSVDENDITFELTLNGEAISKPAFVYVYVTDDNGTVQYFDEWDNAIQVSNNGFLGFVIYTGEQTEITLSDPSGGVGGDFYLNAIMPSGAIATSTAIHFEAGFS